MKGQQLTRFSVRSLSVLCFQERCGEKGSRDGSVGGGPAENEGAHGQGRGGGGSDDQVPGGDVGQGDGAPPAGQGRSGRSGWRNGRHVTCSG